MLSDTPQLEVSEAAALRHVVNRLSRRLRKRAEYGLSPSQASVLMTLGRRGRLRLGALARLEQVGKSSMTRLVAKLEEAGYLERSVDPHDGRGFLVEVTEEGGEALRAAIERQDAYLAGQLEALDVNGRRVLRDAVLAMERLLDLRT